MHTIKRRHYNRKQSRKNKKRIYKKNKCKVRIGGVNDGLFLENNDLAPGFYNSIEEQPSNGNSSFYEKLKMIKNKLNFFSKIDTTNLRNYKNINELGKGGFGKVEVWENKQDKTKSFAIKTQTYVNKGDDKYKILLIEIEMLKYIKNLDDNKCKDNILCFKGVYDDNNNKQIYIATDYDTNYIGLNNIIKQISTLVYSFEIKDNNIENILINNHSIFCIKILSEIFKAIKFLHDSNIVHNDIKPENILCRIGFKNNKIDIENITEIKVKIIDFGLSCLYKSENNNNILLCNLDTLSGTPGFMDPIKMVGDTKIINIVKDNYIKCDYWALGIIFRDLVCTNLYIDRLWNTEYKINNTDRLYNFLDFTLYDIKEYCETYTHIECENRRKELNTEYVNYYFNFKHILSNNSTSELQKKPETIIFIIKYRLKFQILKRISDMYNLYASENNIPFARIEDLLNPTLSERKLFAETVNNNSTQ